MLVVHRTVESNLEPVLSVTELQALHDARRARSVLLRLFQFVIKEVAHVVVVVEHGERVHVPHAGRVDGGIEHQAHSCVPVTVDILGPCGLTQ